MVQIIHNPRCSKSRQTLQLLEQQGIAPDIVEYLKTPLSLDEITSIKTKLGVSSAVEMMRTKEDEFKTAGLSAQSDEAQLLQAMVDYPKLIERPIVINGDKAKIGRPPEDVLAIL